MRAGMKALVAAAILLLLALLLLPVILPAFNGPGQYTVKPGNAVEPEPSASVPVVSFWQLPLWVKVAGIIDTIAVAAFLLAAPLIIGRMQNVLENRNRLSIFNYVLRNPGCTQSEISSVNNMKSGTVKYHVQMLASEGKLTLRRMGKFTRLFNSSRANSELEKVVLSYIKNETSKSLLCAIMEEPGVTNGRLSERFRLDKSSVHWHLERFMSDRLVRFEQDGRYKRYFIEPAVEKMLRGLSS